MIMPMMAQKGRKCGAWDATSAARLDVVVGDTESLLGIYSAAAGYDFPLSLENGRSISAS